MGDNLLKTPIDAFLDLVRAKRQLTLPEAAGLMKETEDVLERWALMLDKRGLLKLVYPENPFDKPFVKAVAAQEAKK